MALRRALATAAAAAAVLATTSVATAASPVDVSASLVDVFTQGSEGYACYRIPALLTLPAPGQLLAFAEGRRYSCGDHGYVDLVVKSSLDGGATWGPLRKVYGESSRAGNVTIGNPAPVYDGARKRVLLPYSRNNLQAGLLASADGGVTWDAPTPIPVPSDWSWVATGPPGSLLLPSGRLVVPADHAPKGGSFASHTFYSDDGGVTWNVSNSVAQGNECQAVALPWVSDAALLLSMRTSVSATRAVARSADGGATWGPPVFSIAETECEGSVVALPGHPRGPTLVISSAFSVAARANLTLHTSRDDGGTWAPAVQVYPGPAAYSSLVAAAGGASVGVLFERDGYAAIAYAVVPVP